ncbi:hypothetical protein F5882DRAFT_421241 [Hyaloscypha sp. PMI_1271]|nr:hypothetical protein F5882DRAFT_421241 [Hyaloscypha sp. PMI_1271]
MVGVGTSDENQRKCRLWWKDLSDMQNASVVCTLLYRSTKFNKYCKTFPRRKQSPRELDTVVSWEKVCGTLQQEGNVYTIYSALCGLFEVVYSSLYVPYTPRKVLGGRDILAVYTRYLA